MVKAVDRGIPPKEGTTRVVFKLTNNAQNPIWLNETGTIITVSENQTLNTPFAHFVAESNYSDPTVTFFLVSGSTTVKSFENFKIRRKGNVMELLLDKQLDYESKKEYNLRARVTVSTLLFIGGEKGMVMSVCISASPLLFLSLHVCECVCFCLCVHLSLSVCVVFLSRVCFLSLCFIFVSACVFLCMHLSLCCISVCRVCVFLSLRLFLCLHFCMLMDFSFHAHVLLSLLLSMCICCLVVVVESPTNGLNHSP